MRHTILKTFAVLFSAFLCFLSFPNPLVELGNSFLVYVSFIFLLSALEKEKMILRIYVAGIFGLSFYLLFAQSLSALNPLGHLIFAVSFAAQPVLFSAFYRFSLANGWLNLVYIPSLWVTTEWLRALLLSGFSWTIGYSQAFYPVVIQIAQWTGSYGISFLIIFINVFLYQLFRSKKRAIFYLSLALLFVVWSSICFSNIRKQGLERADLYSVCAIQPNIPAEQKLDPAFLDINLRRHEKLVKQCLFTDKPGLIIWPETAVGDDILQNRYINTKIRKIVGDADVPQLIGSALFIGQKDYNSAVLMDKDGEMSGLYSKNYLIPFAEYFPLGGLLKNILYKKNYEFYPGKGVGFFSFRPMVSNKAVKFFGVVICSEDHYPKLFKKLTQGNTDFVVVMLNDGWFLQRSARMIHAQASIMRAVEFGVPVLRVANTGLTCLIDRDGRIRSRLPMDQEGVFQVNFNLQRRQTFYGEFGDIFSYLCVIFVIIVLLTFSITKGTKKSSIINEQG